MRLLPSVLCAAALVTIGLQEVKTFAQGSGTAPTAPAFVPPNYDWRPNSNDYRVGYMPDAMSATPESNLQVAERALKQGGWTIEPTGNGRAYLTIPAGVTAQTMKWFTVVGNFDDKTLEGSMKFFSDGQLMIIGSIVMGRIPQDRVDEVIKEFNTVNYNMPHGRFSVNSEQRTIEYRTELVAAKNVLNLNVFEYELKVHQEAMEGTLKALAKRSIQLEPWK